LQASESRRDARRHLRADLPAGRLGMQIVTRASHSGVGPHASITLTLALSTYSHLLGGDDDVLLARPQ
jgi:hypothetical protein